MENRFGAPASGTPEERSARREFELLLLLSGSRKGAVQLWKWERRQRIYANAQQAAGRPATEAKGSRGAAERQAGGESKPETAAQAARRHRSEHRLREKHLARKIWAAVRVRKHLSRWCERARAAVAKRPASSSTTSTAAAAPPPAPPPPPPAPDQAQARATPPAGAAAAASSAPDIFMMEGPQEGELPLQPLTHTLDAAATPAVPDPALADPLPPEPNPAPAPPAAPDASHGATSAPQTIPAVPSATEPQVNANALPAADTTPPINAFNYAAAAIAAAVAPRPTPALPLAPPPPAATPAPQPQPSAPEACADVPPRQLVGAAATGQPEQERGAQLIAAARGSLPLRSVTQQRRGTKHQTPSRNRPPTSQPASPEPDAPPKKTRGTGAVSAALAAAAPAAAPPSPRLSKPPSPDAPLPFGFSVEKDGVRWTWAPCGWTPSGAQCSKMGVWKRGGTAP